MPRLLALQHRPHAQLWINVLPERPELLLLADGSLSSNINPNL